MSVSKGIDSPTVTAVVSTFNRCQYLGECLDSLLGQTHPLHQIIVVDDGSTDATRDVLSRYRARIEAYSQPNRGKAAAINSIIPRIQGDYVWIFDDDDVALPDAVQRHLDALDHQVLDDAFTYGTCVEGREDPFGNIITERDRNVPVVPRDSFLTSLLTRCFLLTQAMLIPAAAIRAVGGLEPQLIRSQDYDLFIKIARICRPVRVDGPLFILRRHAGARGSLEDRFAHEDKAQRWHHYEKLIISRVCEELPLHDYLPRSLQGSSQSTSLLRHSYLQRFAIRAIRGLWAEALSDLFAANRLMGGDELSHQERQICWSSMSEWLALEELFASRELMRDYRAAFRTISRDLSAPLLKGIYYTLRRDASVRRAAYIVRSLLQSLLLSRRIRN
jgi:glycosyltransferase involved in cell wall biosynthesis